jgi:hypothetical protein
MCTVGSSGRAVPVAGALLGSIPPQAATMNPLRITIINRRNIAPHEQF